MGWGWTGWPAPGDLWDLPGYSGAAWGGQWGQPAHQGSMGSLGMARQWGLRGLLEWPWHVTSMGSHRGSRGWHGTGSAGTGGLWGQPGLREAPLQPGTPQDPVPVPLQLPGPVAPHQCPLPRPGPSEACTPKSGPRVPLQTCLHLTPLEPRGPAAPVGAGTSTVPGLPWDQSFSSQRLGELMLAPPGGGSDFPVLPITIAAAASWKRHMLFPSAAQVSQQM